MSARNPRAFGLMIDPERLLAADRYPFGEASEPQQDAHGTSAQRVLALARALSSSPVWQEMDEAVLVVRTQPPEAIAFLGRFSDEEAARLHWLPTQLQTELPHFRYVSWQQTEADVEELASRLLARFGREEIRQMRFVGIPRGGLIVLGMLSYALGLGSASLDSDTANKRPLVVVDDCALSGLRFREFLRARAAVERKVVFAHLYSHLDLRREVERREAQVVAAVAARDLRDVAPEIYGEEVAAWRSRWRERDADNVYLVGRFEHLCFPWSEPDLTYWDETEQRARLGWRLVPPEACLKNRATASPVTPRLQIQDQEHGSMRLASGTLYGGIGDQVLVAQLESGQVISLDGVAADLWRGFIRSPDPNATLDAVQAQYAVSREDLLDDATAFLQELTRRGFASEIPVLTSTAADKTPDA